MSTQHSRAEKRLGMANSYSRAVCIFTLFAIDHPERVKLLGQEWSGCDRYPTDMSIVLECLPCPALDAMTPEEQDRLASLPKIVDIWRGCYQHNRDGLCWSLDRKVASRFPTLNRYRHADKEPMLLHGRVQRRDILFVKLDRKECEVVPKPKTVEIIEQLKID